MTRVYTACPLQSNSGQLTGHGLSFTICSESPPFASSQSDSTELNVIMHITHTHTRTHLQTQTYTDKCKEYREEGGGDRERCILDLNKALRDVRKPVFGQEENAKQALHQTLKRLNHLLEGELSRNACSQNRSSSEKPDVFELNKTSYLCSKNSTNK